MAATATMKVYTGTNAATVSPDAVPGTNAATFNFLSIDAYDAGTTYQSNPIYVPLSGTQYSYERWIRIYFSGAFATVNNIKIYKSSGVFSDAALSINAGVTAVASTPIMTPSAIAVVPIPTTSAGALDATPAGAPLVAPGYSKYIVLQLAVPSSVVTPNEMGTITYTIMWDET